MTDAETVSIKEYFESRLTAMERAITIADESMNLRLEGMNEFRDALRDQTAKFATRAEVILMLDPILKDIRELRESKATLEGKASQQSVNIATIISVTGLLFGAAGLLIAILRGF